MENATKRLKDGQWVAVDGVTGEIGILTKHSIQFAQWDITGRCNLRCQHCRAWKLLTEKELSTEEGKDLLSQLYDLKIQVLNFSGGEPFLRKDIFKLMDYAKDFPLLTITTNGTSLLDKKYIKMLKPFKNIRISLSLDGLEKFHDNFRQVSGTFKKALAAVRNLTEESIRISIRFTLTSLNENEAEPLFDLVSKYKIESFNIRAVLPLGRADASMMPSSKRYQKILENLLVKSRKKKIPIISGDPILLPLFPELLGKVWDEMREKVFSEICAGCLAGEETLYIKPNGDVGVCPYVPKTVGNVKERPLIEMINKTSLFQKLDNYREKLKGKCKECKFKYLCGGCRAVALVLNKDLYGEDPRCLVHYPL